MIQAALQDAAAVAMCRNLDARAARRVENELKVALGKMREALLHDVVAVEICDQGDSIDGQGADHQSDLRRTVELINDLLNGSCAVHVERYLARVRADRAEEGLSLQVIGMLEKLLAEIVAEWVSH